MAEAMMHTPIPLRWSGNMISVVVCDVCGQTITVKRNDVIGALTLPSPWRRVGLSRWVGMLDVCSDECERKVRDNEGGGTDRDPG